MSVLVFDPGYYKAVAAVADRLMPLSLGGDPFPALYLANVESYLRAYEARGLRREEREEECALYQASLPLGAGEEERGMPAAPLTATGALELTHRFLYNVDAPLAPELGDTLRGVMRTLACQSFEEVSVVRVTPGVYAARVEVAGETRYRLLATDGGALPRFPDAGRTALALALHGRLLEGGDLGACLDFCWEVEDAMQPDSPVLDALTRQVLALSRA